MRKFGLFFLFLIFYTEAFASPARFGGFSYKKDKYGRVVLNEASESFNEGPAQLEEEPQQPYYLNEEQLPVQSQEKYQLIYTMEDVYREIEANQKKSSVNYKVQEDKYATPPIYSMKDLHEKKLPKPSKKASKSNDNEEDDDEEEEEEE